MDLALITPLILPSNVEAGIERTLQPRGRAVRMVADSFSTDDTLKFPQGYSQVKIVHCSLDSFSPGAM